MAEQNALKRDSIKLQPLASVGLLEQFNLPPKAIRFIRRNQRMIWLVITVSVVGSLAVSGYNTWRGYVDNKAATALDAALIAQKDKRQLLEAVVQEYGSTSSGLWAKIELAILDDKEGKQPQAISRLEEINSGIVAGSPLKPLVLTKLAGLYENEQKYDKAIALTTELTALEGFAPAAYRALGRLNEQLGKKEEAVAMYEKYLELTDSLTEREKTDPMRGVVQSRLNQLKK